MSSRERRGSPPVHNLQAVQSALLLTMVEGVILQAADGTILSANQAATEILGLSTDVLTGMRSLDPRWRSIDENGQPLPAGCHPAMIVLGGGGPVRDFKMGIYDGRDQLRWLRVNSAPVLGDKGEIIGSICGFTDITESHESDRKLAEALDLYSSVLDAATEQSIIGIDLDGFITLFNVGAQRMLGYRENDVLGTEIQSLHDPSEINARAEELGVEPGLAALITVPDRQQRSETRQWTYLTSEGGRLQVSLSVSAMHDASGDVTGYIGVATDVTQQRRAEQHLANERRRLRAAHSIGRLGAWELDIASDAVDWSDGVYELFGIDGADTHAEKTLRDCVDVVARDQLASALAACAQEGRAVRHRFRAARADDGQPRWFDVRAERIADSTGSLRVAGMVADVTETVREEASNAFRRETVRVAQQQEALLASLVEGVIVQGKDGLILSANRAACEFFGMSSEEMIGHNRKHLGWSFLDENGQPLALEERPSIKSMRENVSVRSSYIGLITPTRPLRWIRANSAPVIGELGEVVGAIIGFSDVTEQRRSEQNLTDSEERFRLAFQAAPIGMSMIDLAADSTGNIVRANRSMCVLTGRSEQELLSLGLQDVLHPDDIDATRLLMQQLGNGAEAVHSERRFRRPDGSTVWGQLGVSVIPQRDDRPSSAICLVEDITARKVAEEMLLHQMLHDPLTGLPSRRLLHDRIAHALAAAGRSGVPIGVIYVDLDGFKSVNDSDGHAAGDEVLSEVARRLTRVVRPGDTVARLGGDEFAIICVDVAQIEALKAAASRVLHTLSEPFSLSTGSTHHISGSVGMCLSGSTSDPEQMLADADAAMYTAKKAGKNRISLPRLEEQARAGRAARLRPQLYQALEDDRLILHGQPVLDLATHRTVAVETLIRWRHPIRGTLPPSEFLDVAEQSPLMIAVGQRVLRESCRMAAAWCEALGATAPDVHVNVSGRQLESGRLASDVLDALTTYALPANRLVLELTETHMPSIADSLREDLNELRSRGIRIAIDDLGTGYSSLTRITELPVDMLKIDLSFIAGLGTDPACHAVVRAILSLGQEMGLSVVAEGVETPRQEELLASYGCDTVQGYLYSPPRPEYELLGYLADKVAMPQSH